MSLSTPPGRHAAHVSLPRYSLVKEPPTNPGFLRIQPTKNRHSRDRPWALFRRLAAAVPAASVERGFSRPNSTCQRHLRTFFHFHDFPNFHRKIRELVTTTAVCGTNAPPRQALNHAEDGKPRRKASPAQGIFRRMIALTKG